MKNLKSILFIFLMVGIAISCGKDKVVESAISEIDESNTQATFGKSLEQSYFEEGVTYNFYSTKLDGSGTYKLALTLDETGTVNVVQSEVAYEEGQVRSVQSTEDIFVGDESGYSLSESSNGIWMIHFDGSGVEQLNAAGGGAPNVVIECGCSGEVNAPPSSGRKCRSSAVLKDDVYTLTCKVGTCTGTCDVIVRSGVNELDETVLFIRADNVEM